MSTINVPREYLHVDMSKEKRNLMNLRGGVVDTMCQFNPYYEQHVRYENGKKVLYLLLIREIYG